MDDTKQPEEALETTLVSEEPTPQETTKEENKSSEEPTLGELLGEEKPQENEEESVEESIKDQTVPLSVLLDVKRELKELKEKNRELIGSDLLALSKQYNVDQEFMLGLAEVLEKRTTAQIQKKYEPILQKQAQESIENKKEQMFKKVYNEAIESMPDIKDIANENVIKQLAFDPSNSKKGIKQIIKDVYGSVIEKSNTSPSPSFEKSSHTSRDNEIEIDFNNPTPEQLADIKKDPKKMKAWIRYVENLSL